MSEEQAKQVIAAEGKNSGGPDVRDRMEARERAERLLEGFDERDRLMLIVNEVEGFAVEEIAQILDLNANTVKVRLFRARRRVVNKVRKRGE